MGEYHTVALGKKIAYHGYFDFAKLWKLIRDYMESRGFIYIESVHHEIVKEHGKEIRIDVDVHRELSDYVKGRIKIDCVVRDLKDVQLDNNGHVMVLNEGSVELDFEAYVVTDYEGRFEDKTILFFIRTILEKWVYSRQISKFKHIVHEDLDALTKEIKAYLNLFSY